MYGQYVISEKESEPLSSELPDHMQDAKRMAEAIINYPPQHQNEMISKIIPFILEQRKADIKETESRAEFLRQELQALQGLLDGGAAHIKTIGKNH
jgi:polyhydroxyalkanoate synthesis regulator phasin